MNLIVLASVVNKYNYHFEFSHVLPEFWILRKKYNLLYPRNIESIYHGRLFSFFVNPLGLIIQFLHLSSCSYMSIAL